MVDYARQQQQSQQLGALTPARIEGVDLLIETVPVAGSEPTSGRADEAMERVSAAFARGQDVIVAIASKMAGTVSEMGARAVRPDKLEVEFGLSFAASGHVIVVGSTAEASLKVTITYDRHEPGGTPPSAQVVPVGTVGTGSA